MKHFTLLLTLLLALTTGCAAPSSTESSGPVPGGDIPNVQLVFDGDVAPLLASDDDYIQALSPFDNAAKYRSTVPLNYDQRLKLFNDSLEPYSDKEKARIAKAFDTVKDRMAGISITVPEQIHVFCDSVTESGEAYTRKNAVCLPKKLLSLMSDKKLTELMAHETFHILSRYNPEKRENWYGILGYKKTQEMPWPPELQPLTIANPDAPHNGFVIRCSYEGTPYDFMHVLYSKGPYDLKSNKTFFKYLQQGMLAVEVVNGVPTPVYSDGKPLLVQQSDLSDYTGQVGKNTKYTIHPEEITADHFAALLMGTYSNKPNPEKIEALKTMVFEVR